MTNDAMDDVLEGDGDEAETDAIVSQVLDEIGIHLNQSVCGVTWHGGFLDLWWGRVIWHNPPPALAPACTDHFWQPPPSHPQLVDAPQSRVGGAAVAVADSRQPVALSDDDALQARLDSLRKG